MSHCFDDTVNKSAFVFSTKFKSQVSSKDRCVDKWGQTAGTCFGKGSSHVAVHGQSTLCIVGSIAELKVVSEVNHSVAAVPGLTISNVSLTFVSRFCL